MKTFVFGDIHGCLNQLQDILQKIGISKRNRYIFLGDYIDRGPNSKGVIDCLLEIKKLIGNSATFLMGNHEEIMINALLYPGSEWEDTWGLNGGWETVKSYGGQINNIPKTHLDFIYNLPLFYNQYKNYFFCHAGVDPYKPLNNQSKDDLLWSRDFYNYTIKSPEKKIIFGHTIQREGPLIRDHMIGIDTGCFITDKLTCLELPAERFIYNGNYG